MPPRRLRAPMRQGDPKRHPSPVRRPEGVRHGRRPRRCRLQIAPPRARGAAIPAAGHAVPPARPRAPIPGAGRGDAPASPVPRLLPCLPEPGPEPGPVPALRPTARQPDCAALGGTFPSRSRPVCPAAPFPPPPAPARPPASGLPPAYCHVFGSARRHGFTRVAIHVRAFAAPVISRALHAGVTGPYAGDGARPAWPPPKTPWAPCQPWGARVGCAPV